MNALVQHQVSDIERMARAFAASKLFGVQNVEQALALCLIAQAEGRHPASAAADYHIMNGKPAKKAEAMLRDFISGGGKVEWHTLDDAKADATFSHPAGSARIEWTLERAKKAGINSPMWTKYPRQMLRSRVVSEGVRTVYPMATSGMYEPGEVADFATDPKPQQAPPAAIAEMRDVTPREKPAPASDAPLDKRGKPILPDEYGRFNANQCKTITTVRSDNGKVITKWELAGKLPHEMTDIREATELLAFREVWAAEISTWPLSWEQKFWADYDLHMEGIGEAAAVMFREEDQNGVAGRVSDMDPTGEDYLTRQFKASIAHEAAKAVV